MKLTLQMEFYQVPCCVCAIVFYVPEDFVAARRKDGARFYCPNGHNLSYGESEADKLRRERDRLKQNAARLESELDAARQAEYEQRQIAKKAEAEARRVAKRAKAALCPCCNRSFSQLARHMKVKHPGMLPALTGSGARQ